MSVRIIYDKSYDIKGWCDPTLAIEGWFGKRFSDFPKVAIIQDDFNDNSINYAKWGTATTSDASIAETSNQIELTSATTQYDIAQLYSLNKYSLISSIVTVNIIDVGLSVSSNITSIPITLKNDDNNRVYIYINGGVMGCNDVIGGTYDTKLGAVPYNSSVHKYVRLREHNGYVYFDFSTNGSSWFNIGSSNAITIDFGRLLVACEILPEDPGVNTSTILKLDNFNIASETPKTETLIDDFNDNSIDTGKWALIGSGTVTESGSKIIITPVPSTAGATIIGSINTYSLVGSYVQVQLLQSANNNCDTTLEVVDIGYVDAYLMISSGGALYASSWVGGNLNSIAFNSTTMAYWRIRETSGIIYWEYSQYGTVGTWTTLHSIEAAGWEISVFQRLDVNEWASTPTPGAGWFDNFNVISVGIKVWNGSSWNYKPVKVWNGSSWVQKPVKVWDGGAWIVKG